MPQINTPESHHVGPPFIPGVTLQYLPYANARFLGVLKSAIAVVGSRIVRHSPCNQAFKALPGRRTLRDVWADRRLWINFDPSRNGQDFGETTGFEITITEYALAMGHWTTSATLVHELAHVDGAPSSDTQAEDTLMRCLLPGLHDPTIVGQIRMASRIRFA